MSRRCSHKISAVVPSYSRCNITESKRPFSRINGGKRIPRTHAFRAPFRLCNFQKHSKPLWCVRVCVPIAFTFSHQCICATCITAVILALIEPPTVMIATKVKIFMLRAHLKQEYHVWGLFYYYAATKIVHQLVGRKLL